MIDPRLKRIREFHTLCMSEALKTMFLTIQGSPEYDKAYAKYREHASVLANPLLRDEILKVIRR